MEKILKTKFFSQYLVKTEKLSAYLEEYVLAVELFRTDDEAEIM